MHTQAISARRYGSPDVLEWGERAVPPLGPTDVRVRVRAAGVNPADVHLLRGQPFFLRFLGYGLFAPRHAVPGSDVAGRVDAVGPAVRDLRPGDDVFANLSEVGRGGFAEFVVAPGDVWAPMPADLDYDAAAAIPMAGVTALQGLREGGIQPGDEVVIHGASGGVGTFAVQIAVALGARVTGVSSGRNTDLVASLGAERTVDYTRDDWTAEGRRYDLVLDTVGNRSLADIRRALKPRGAFVTTAFLPSIALRGRRIERREGVRLRNLMATADRDDLVELAALVEAGRVTPVLDRGYSLAQASEALRYVGGRRARGKVVLRA